MSQDKIKGKAFVLGKNIDTDQIIPAKHLVYSLEDPEERKFYGRYALSGVPDAESGLPQGNIPFTDPEKFESDFQIVVAGPNFGCGSSREHAPESLMIAGAKAVVAPTYARIFYRNSVDGGFIVPFESVRDLSEEVETYDELEIDRDKNEMKNLTQGTSYGLKPLGSVAEIVEAGGIFEYARQTGMVER
ncbi:MAG: 3-isopropylmalate dehydratase [Candidatus Marinimicrobia bacterium]|nr:3-isopropylmalate dehydratase [Candidatus Neomarinimicrobiota bacterium]MCF7828671.1 3-isopropylmalate dehydratase [Candidatus Neomarinimicrobiota bacterium]MCF7880412.1 3-isopropylmalate dehydratase [Candidatus Neomarinimicrobiota bacterium]